jgi:hypothetical protein
MSLDTSNDLTADSDRVGWLIATLVFGIAAAISLAMISGALDGVERTRVLVGQPPPQSLNRTELLAGPKEVFLVHHDTHPHKITHMVVASHEASVPLQMLVSSENAAMARAIGDARIVVVTTPDEYDALREFIAFANLELMPGDYTIELLDLRYALTQP